MRDLLIVLAIVAVLMLAIRTAEGRIDRIEIANADYQRCVTVRNKPLVPPRQQIPGTARLSETV